MLKLIILQTELPIAATLKVIEFGIVGCLLVIVTGVLIWTIKENRKERREWDEKQEARQIRHECTVQENIRTIKEINEKNTDAYNRNTAVLNEIKGMIRGN